MNIRPIGQPVGHKIDCHPVSTCCTTLLWLPAAALFIAAGVLRQSHHRFKALIISGSVLASIPFLCCFPCGVSRLPVDPPGRHGRGNPAMSEEAAKAAVDQVRASEADIERWVAMYDTMLGDWHMRSAHGRIRPNVSTTWYHEAEFTQVKGLRAMAVEHNEVLLQLAQFGHQDGMATEILQDYHAHCMIWPSHAPNGDVVGHMARVLSQWHQMVGDAYAVSKQTGNYNLVKHVITKYSCFEERLRDLQDYIQHQQGDFVPDYDLKKDDRLQVLNKIASNFSDAMEQAGKPMTLKALEEHLRLRAGVGTPKALQAKNGVVTEDDVQMLLRLHQGEGL